MLCMFYFYREMLSFHHGHHHDCIHDRLCVSNCLDKTDSTMATLTKMHTSCLVMIIFATTSCVISLGIRFRWLQIICIQYIRVRRIWCCRFIIFNACWWMMTLKKPEIFIEREIIWIELHHHDSFIFVFSIKKGNPFNKIRKLSDLNNGWNR